MKLATPFARSRNALVQRKMVGRIKNIAKIRNIAEKRSTKLKRSPPRINKLFINSKPPQKKRY